MTLRRLDFADSSDVRCWDEFVRAQTGTHPTDLAGWRLLYREMFGLTDVSLAAFDGDTIRGIAGTYLVPSPFFGRMLVSCPYFGYGGLYADDESTLTALVDETERLAAALGVDFIEWRRTTALPAPYELHEDFLEFSLPLGDDPEQVFRERLASNARQNVRKSRRHGLDFRVSSDPTEAWLLISRTIRDLGTPFHARRFFELLVRHFPDEIRFSEVRRGDEVVAAGVLLRFREMLLTPYIGSLRSARETSANYFQYWGIVEHCIEQGVRRFELGRSPVGSSHDRFKRKWGAEPIPVTYSVRPISGRRAYRNVTSASRLEQLATRAWTRVPLAVTRRLGHLVFRHLP